MIDFKINKEKFKLSYLPDYAKYLLENKLTEFVTVGIRFSREADLPLLKPLSKFSEEELVKLGLESNRQILEALAKNKIADHIEASVEKWISNSLSVFDRDDITAEDLTLGFYLRRKIFTHFLDAYTKNVVLQKFIIGEVDDYTTQEELMAYGIYFKMQQQKLQQVNMDLAFHKEILLSGEELGGTGSFSLNIKYPEKSFYSPEYKRVLEIDERIAFDEFINFVHADDRALLQTKINTAYKEGGIYEVEYRYNKSNDEKRIWSKGFIIVEEGKPIIIRGVIKRID
ncbi:MAG TPA: PAS domain-containing protein [Bacteroidia bacterium]|nr:PAS domain-containing protein [Bacteroidia bacterium]